ncbi:terminase small subunit [Staphylococcus chromogenes]|nr:terminase small subunit [Staphylococcus chromogenes]
MGELNKRQRTFAEAYAIPGTQYYGNATKSTVIAGYSEKTAYSQGQRMLKKVEVQNYIRDVEEKLFDENIMTGKEVLYRLTKTAKAEHSEVEAMITKTGNYKENPNNGNFQLVYDEAVQLVSRPPKISDQNKALELLGKHHKLFTDVQDVTQRNITLNVGEYDDND